MYVFPRNHGSEGEGDISFPMSVLLALLWRVQRLATWRPGPFGPMEACQQCSCSIQTQSQPETVLVDPIRYFEGGS